MANPKKSITDNKVIKSKPLPKKKKPDGSGGAGDAALSALAGHNSRGRSQFLIGNVRDIEILEEKRRALNKQINGIYAAIKHNGFSVQATRRVVALRRLDKEEREHLEENIAIVKEALGEQLTLWDRAAMGETREAPDAHFDEVCEEAPAVQAEGPKVVRGHIPDPETVALSRAAASSIGDDQGNFH